MSWEQDLVDVKNKRRGVIPQRVRTSKRRALKHKKYRVVASCIWSDRLVMGNYETLRDAENALNTYRKNWAWRAASEYQFHIEVIE